MECAALKPGLARSLEVILGKIELQLFVYSIFKNFRKKEELCTVGGHL